MKQRKLPNRSAFGRYALPVVASSALLTAGCANMTSTAPAVNPIGQSATVAGKVHGGSQPVAGATVSLYYAGQSGLRSAATLAATTTTASNGTFAFSKDPVSGNSHPSSGNTFSCPTSVGDPQVYVIARGGNTQDATSGFNNSASAFLAGLGSCSSISTSTFVTMSEVTTVATLAAVQQYMDPISESIGADGILISYTGLENAFHLASALLVDLSNGSARSATPQTGASVSVVATPETAKINHIANILTSCVNNASSNNSGCTALLANATPPSLSVTGPSPTANSAGMSTLPPPADVIQAALYMLTNPTDGSPTNLQNLYNLAPAVGAPYQPTLTAVPSDWTIGVMYAATGNCANGGSFIQNANQLSIDVSGDLWISNGGGNLTELSPSGIPLTCQTIAGGGSAGSTIDVNGNIWIAAYSTNNIYRYSPSGGALLTYVTPYAPVGLTADGSGNLFFSTFSTPGVYLLANAANDTSGSQATPVQISSTVGSQPFQLMPDQNSNIWVSSYGNLISKVALNSTTPSSSVTTPFTTDTPSYGIAVTAKHGNDNYVYTAAASTTNDLTYLTGSGTSYSIAGGFPTAAGSAGLNNPLGIAVDGSQNVWAANNHTISSSLGSVSELSGSGAPLSPSTGFQKANTYFGANRSLAIDQSGNVWVGQDNSSTVSEVLGAAIPIYQPYSLGLHNGRFQSIP